MSDLLQDNPAPTTPAIDVRNFLIDLVCSDGSEDDLVEYSDGGVWVTDKALAQLNWIYAEEMLKIVGEDEIKPMHKATIPFRLVHQNKLRAELRTAITKRFLND